VRSKLPMALVILVLLVLVAPLTYGHTPILYVEDFHDGTVYVEGGFSDGSSAAGVKIYLVESTAFSGDTSIRDEYLETVFSDNPQAGAEYLERLGEDIDGAGAGMEYAKLPPELFEGKLVIYRSQLDEYGELILRKPRGEYQIVFDAGPGHVVVKQGPLLTDTEAK